MSGAGTCLLTGATGFIGGHLARGLVREGYDLRCLVRRGSDTSSLQALGAELAVGDLTDARSLALAADGCRYVLHCGALVSDWATVAEIERVNVQGTRNLLAASLAASVERFVHVSSTDVYGHPGRAVEETYVAPRFSNWYSETKLAAETDVRRTAKASALNAVIVRPATVYGPGSESVVGEIAAALRSGNMLLIGRGRALAGLCYVENLVDLLVLSLSHTAAAGETFNATDGLQVTWKQFTDDLASGLSASPARLSVPYELASGLGFALEHSYRALRRATRLQTRPLLSRQAVQVMGRDQRFSNEKARALLGWQPRVGYAEGLAATLMWLEDR